jgi:hypothetical protein
MSTKEQIIIIYINNFEFVLDPEISILEASSFVGFNTSRFCYHETLSIVGTCRICLIEVEKSARPVASCALPIINGLRIHLDTPLVKKARENVIEALLLHHPLDCPICDQAGECDLQEFAKIHGSVYNRVLFRKRPVEDKECGVLIKTIMTRCIHCTRCVRFMTEIAGFKSLGTFGRGHLTEIGGYTSLVLNSELSGNIIDLCPVGALTSKTYLFSSRPWDTFISESLDLTDSTGSNIYIHSKEGTVLRVLPKSNENINSNIISDRIRFSHDANQYQRLISLSRQFVKDPLPEAIDELHAIYEESLCNSKYSRVRDDNNYADKDSVILVSRMLLDARPKTAIRRWKIFFKDVENALEIKDAKLLIIINDELDLEALIAAQDLSYRYKHRIKVRTFSNHSYENILVEDYTGNSIENVKYFNSRFCFTLSCNMRLESSILNGKIRARHFDNHFESFCFGAFCNSNFPLQFVNTRISKVLMLFDGKCPIFSTRFVKIMNSLFFIGESLTHRMSNTSYLMKSIKEMVPTSLLMLIGYSCNSFAIPLLNIKALTKRDLINASLFIVKINDDLVFRYYCYQNRLALDKATYFWIGSHCLPIASENDWVIPTMSLLESKGTFLNLEGRPQNVFNFLKKQYMFTKSVIHIFQSINYGDDSGINLDYITELVKKPKFFFLIENIFSTVSTIIRILVNPIAMVSVYPIKATIEDFHTKGSFCRQSLIMLRCSKRFRLENTAFV